MLDNLIREYGGREICAEVYIDKAGWLRGLGASYMDEVLQVCDEGVKRYPAYKRINERTEHKGECFAALFECQHSRERLSR